MIFFGRATSLAVSSRLLSDIISASLRLSTFPPAVLHLSALYHTSSLARSGTSPISSKLPSSSIQSARCHHAAITLPCSLDRRRSLTSGEARRQGQERISWLNFRIFQLARVDSCSLLTLSELPPKISNTSSTTLRFSTFRLSSPHTSLRTPPSRTSTP